MCNYLGYKVTHVQFIQLNQIEKVLGSHAALNVLRNGFEYGNWEVVKANEAVNDVEIESMHWEFLPPWIKTMDEVKQARKQGIPWLNATAEKLLSSKMFRESALKRRCLVIASCFYEWRHFKPAHAKKDVAYPYLVNLPGQEYFYMAGIWQPWTDKETGETMNTFAIVTTAANSLMQQVHNNKKRMPTILPEALAYEWLLGNPGEQRIQELAAYQLDSKYMNAYSIQKDFRQQEDPIAAFDYEELPALVK